MSTAKPLHCRIWRAAPSTRPATPAGAALLLHGAESHSGWMTGVAARLAAAGLPAVAYDRRGWGQSPGPRGRLASAEAALAELQAVAAQLQRHHGPVHLVGLSWGGLLAAVARDSDPDLGLASVTLVAPAIRPLKRPPPPALLRAALGGRANLPLVPADFTASSDHQRFIAADPFRMTAVDWGFCRATLALQARLTRAPLGLGTTDEGTGAPLSLLLAEDDAVVDSEAARRWVEARGGRVTVVPGTRHSLVLEAPAAVAAAVLDGARAATRDARSKLHAS